ncbi:cytochrome P450 [Cercophora scortea]|uniref:Cytochrome P450 n=1 Tax=Cercophora scortea TaxID=314031 RepID=A0AAE0IFK8_9PEZI|nr:cytochrome P450 [Cercophora scortea]
MALPPSFLTLGAVALVLSVLFKLFFQSRSKLPPPDGPPTLPIIGNLHQIPKTGAHRKFTEWAKTYGGIFSLKLGPSLAVVITDRRLVKELMDKKSSMYSARPPSYVSHDLITKGDHLLVMNYGASWRTFRRTMHQFFNEGVCDKQHISLVEAETTQMLRDFLDRPEKHMVHTKRTSNSIIMSLVFGVRTESDQTPHMKELYSVMDKWSEIMEVGATPPVDIFPFLKLLPESWLGNWIQRSLDVGTRMKTLYSSAQTVVSTRRRQHGTTNTFMDQVLDQQDKLNLTPNQLDFIGGVLMEGGSDTVSTMMLVIIQALALNPHIQARAQAEIDAVCTDAASPTWSHYAQLPYITSIIKEAIRWRPVTPLAFPHALSQDDVIDGKFLPAGTTVLLNVWGLHHDPSRFPDPDKFDPSRFANQTKLAAEYAASPDYDNRDHYLYGAGRRICPGIHLAEREMFIAASKLLWGFEFAQQRDAEGRLVPIDTDPLTGYTEGFLVCPKAFACKVTPRSEARAATIRREFGVAEREVLSRYRG